MIKYILTAGNLTLGGAFVTSAWNTWPHWSVGIAAAIVALCFANIMVIVRK